MTTTLQRSSVSFRRQGSSGHIWDDRLLFLDLHSGEIRSPVTTAKTREEIFKEIGRKSRSFDSAPSSRSEGKAQKCGLSSVFGRCMGSSTS